MLGEDPKQANASKLAGNMMITMAIEAMAEAMVLSGSTGLAPQAFFDLILGTLFGCPVYRSYSARIVSGDFEAGFTMNLGLKDLRLAAAAAKDARSTLPLLDAVRGRMAEAVESGMGDKGLVSIRRLRLARAAGMTDQEQSISEPLDRILTRLREREDVWWARNDQIARWVRTGNIPGPAGPGCSGQ